MTTTLTNEQDDRRVVIRRSPDAPNPRLLKTPVGRLIQMYQAREYGDEQMGGCDLAAVADHAQGNGGRVIDVWETEAKTLVLSTADGRPPNTEPAGIIVIDQSDVRSMGNAEMKRLVADELEEINQWLTGEVYRTDLETRAGETDQWIVAQTLGYFYGPDHQRSGLYAAVGVPESKDQRENAGWRESPPTTDLGPSLDLLAN